MERLTHERVNGIKTGYWSAATKVALGRGLRVGVEDVLDHLVHLIVDALLEGAAGHRHDAVALVLFVHGVSPFFPLPAVPYFSSVSFIAPAMHSAMMVAVLVSLFLAACSMAARISSGS